MPVKPFKAWKKKLPGKAEADQISSFVLDWNALRYAMRDSVCETRGSFETYRVGDVLKSIRGGRFHR